MNLSIGAVFEVKTRDTIAFAFKFTEDDGQPIDLSKIEVSSSIKNAKDRLVTNMDVNILDAASGDFIVSLPQDIILPVGTLYLDVLLKKGRAMVHGDAIELDVKSVVTYG